MVFYFHNNLDPKIYGLQGLMRSMLDKSKFMNTQIFPGSVMKKNFNSNISTIGMLDKMMKSCSLNNPKFRGDTKLWETKNNFEDIDEALHSESKGSTHKQYREDKEQSNTSIERDMINISAIIEKRVKNKKNIVENISFESAVHDIYNPSWSSCKNKSELEESIPQFKEDNLISSNKILNEYEITLNDQNIKKKISPIRIRKKLKIMSKLVKINQKKERSLLSRNISQNTIEEKSS